jgi:hypothetical protein
MNNDEKDKKIPEAQTPSDEITRLSGGENKGEENNSLEDDIIRNDTIPETSKDTPGSIGAFPVGAFDNSKD